MGSDYFGDSQAVGRTSVEMLHEAGAKILLSAQVSGAITEDNKVRGVFVETKSGTLAIKAKVVIDCTGSADVASAAGAAHHRNAQRPGHGGFPLASVRG